MPLDPPKLPKNVQFVMHDPVFLDALEQKDPLHTVCRVETFADIRQHQTGKNTCALADAVLLNHLGRGARAGLDGLDTNAARVAPAAADQRACPKKQAGAGSGYHAFWVTVEDTVGTLLPLLTNGGDRDTRTAIEYMLSPEGLHTTTAAPGHGPPAIANGAGAIMVLGQLIKTTAHLVYPAIVVSADDKRVLGADHVTLASTSAKHARDALPNAEAKDGAGVDVDVGTKIAVVHGQSIAGAEQTLSALRDAELPKQLSVLAAASTVAEDKLRALGDADDATRQGAEEAVAVATAAVSDEMRRVQSLIDRICIVQQWLSNRRATAVLMELFRELVAVDPDAPPSVALYERMCRISDMFHSDLLKPHLSSVASLVLAVLQPGPLPAEDQLVRDDETDEARASRLLKLTTFFMETNAADKA